VQFIAYILIYPFLWLISILPFRVFYVFSDIVYVIVYYIAGYRKTVVTENLKLVFPKKSDKEIFAIRKEFYKHMCDMFLEMIKSISISRTQLSKRFIIKNPEELQRLESLNKSIILMYGHYASYEWSYVIENYLTYKGYGIYKRIKNNHFDKLAKRIRSKYNTTLIQTKEAISLISQNETDGIKSIIAFLSDQSPKYKKAYYWSEFMSIKVPCFTGAEMLAKKLDLSVAYLKVNKIKRGYYQAEFISLADNARTFNDYEITDKFTKALEEQIYETPQYYLWTHKRWKHRNKMKTKA
jgi:Kdo2-lipid IVA lauroyltransferase/acyltransferase